MRSTQNSQSKTAASEPAAVNQFHQFDWNTRKCQHCDQLLQVSVSTVQCPARKEQEQQAREEFARERGLLFS